MKLKNKMNEIEIKNVKIQYNDEYMRILDSYRVTDTDTMIDILINFKYRTGYKSKRTMKSWVKEWRAHNRLYRLGLFKSHTKDCDLEENEKLHRLIAYSILGN